MSIFDKYGYEVRISAPVVSDKNYPYEGPHRYIVYSVRSLMEGHQIPLKLYPYDLSHHIKFHGMVPHGESGLGDELIKPEI